MTPIKTFTLVLRSMAVCMMMLTVTSTIKAQTNIATQVTRLKGRIDNNITNASPSAKVRHDSEGVLMKCVAQLAKNVFDSLGVRPTIYIQSDADFTAEPGNIYILPVLTTSRDISFSGTPADGDVIVFINQNLSGNVWNLDSWTYEGYTGPVTALNNIGSYHIIYVDAIGEWVQY